MPAIEAMLFLACLGGGAAVKPDISTTEGNQSFSGTYNYGLGEFSGSGNSSETRYGTREQGYADQVDVELTGEEGRIRLPRVTLPALRGGNGGWFKLSNIQMTDRAITGSAAVNPLNRPKVHIDRMTGVISINGMNGNYTGRCEAVEASARRF